MLVSKEERNPSEVNVYLLWEIMSVLKLEATEVEQTGLTKVNTFKTTAKSNSVSLTPKIDTVERRGDQECIVKE